MSTATAQRILELKDRITEHVVSEDYARRPHLLARYGEEGRAHYTRDNDYHLAFLSEAVAAQDPELFVDYVAWVRSMLASRGVLLEDLVENLRLLKAALEQQLLGEDATFAVAPVDRALSGLPSLPEMPPSFISVENPHGALAQQFLDRLLEGNRRDAIRLIDQAVEDGLPMKALYLDVFQCSQRELGRLWQLNQITVAQEHFCTAATLTTMNQFYRVILEAPRNGRRIVCCCAAGDLHEMGLRIVADLFELEGWDSDYIGANTPGRDLLDTIERAPPDVIAISATMTYHVDKVRDLVRGVRERPALSSIPILVGGRPFLISEGLWQQVGADGWAADAVQAVEEASRLVDRRRADG